MAPASILQTHAATTVYLDRESAALLSPRLAAAVLERDRVMRIDVPGALRPAGQRLRRRRFQRAGPDRRSRRPRRSSGCARTGVTRCLPTLITSSFDGLRGERARAVAAMTDAGHRRDPHGRAVPLARGRPARRASARARRGRRALDDFNRRQDAAGGRIVLVTLAPEVPGALRAHRAPGRGGRARRDRPHRGDPAADRRRDRRRRDAGDAPRQRLRARCCRGIRMSSGSCSPPTALFASLIVDGHHLPAATVKAMVRAKGRRADDPRHRRDRRRGLSPPGRVQRSAASSASSAPTAACRCRARRILAGSSLTLDRAIANTVRFTGLPIDAVIADGLDDPRARTSARRPPAP